MSLGVVLVVFGSDSEQGKKDIEFFESILKRQIYDVTVYWAFSSPRMQSKGSFMGKKIYSVAEAVKDSIHNGITSIIVQPLHVILGSEYAKVFSTVEAIQKEISSVKILVGEPLITEEIFAVNEVVNAIFESIPEDRKSDEAVVFMGHGNPSSKDDKYVTVSNLVNAKDSLVFVGTMEGSYRIEHIIPCLAQVKKVWLLPLLALVGKHALEDMAGVDPSSWRSKVEKEGKECVPVLRGMIGISCFANIWMNRLEKVMSLLDTD